MKLLARFNPDIGEITPYRPGPPIEQVAESLGVAPESISKLASNESALGVSPLALAALEAELSNSHRYPDGSACVLRARIATKYGLEPDQVIVGNGSNEILELVGHCLLHRDASAVFSNCAFAVYGLICKMFGALAIRVPMADGMVHDLTAMRKAVTEQTSVVFICNPNNPTGTTAEPSEIEAFVRDMAEDVLVVIDEAYAEISLAPLPDSVGLLREAPNVLVCRTFSKAYGLAGLRLGYGLGAPAVVDAMQRARQPFNVNRLAQVAGVAALDDDEFIAASRAHYAKAKIFFEGACEKMGLSYVASVANFMLIEVGDGQGLIAGLKAQGIIVRAMDGYGLPGHIRVSYGTDVENLCFMQALAGLLGKEFSANE